MRRILAIILAMFILLSVTGICTVEAEKTDAQRLNNEAEANAQYQKLVQHIFEHDTQNGMRTVNVDYYGGAYLNEEGNLVVCVTSNYDAESKEIEQFTNNEKVVIQKVEYTFNELYLEQYKIAETMNSIFHNLYVAGSAEVHGVDYLQSNAYQLASSFRGTYIDEERNVLAVQIDELTRDKIELFKELISSKSFIVFEEGHNNTTTATALKPGAYLCTSSSSLSVGYPVYFTNSNGDRELGFISAGHAYDVGEAAKVNMGSSIALGICVASMCTGTTDAALIRITNPNYEVSFTTYYGGVSLVEENYATPIRGTTLYKEGSTSGRTSGTILSNCASVSVTNSDGSTTVLRDVILTTVLNLGGDSGGVAYTPNGLIVGSMSCSSYTGTSLTADTFEYSYICKYENAASVLNCSVEE